MSENEQKGTTIGTDGLDLSKVTWELHCFSYPYIMTGSILSSYSQMVETPLLACAETRNLKLNDRLKVSVKDIRITTRRSIADYVVKQMENTYCLPKGSMDDVYLHNLFFLESSLCAVTNKSGQVFLATRNRSVLDKLVIIGGREETDIEEDYLEMGANDVIDSTITVKAFQATSTGYLMDYATVSLIDATIIPFAWYMGFLNRLRKKLQNGCYEISYYNGHNISTVSATAKKFTYSDEITKAASFIENNPCDKLSEVQFVNIETRKVQCIRVADIVDIDFLCY